MSDNEIVTHERPSTWVDSHITHAGWRPVCGWTCAAAIIYELVAVPMTASLFNVLSSLQGMKAVELAHVNTTFLFEVFLVVVGARSLDKYNKVSS